MESLLFCCTVRKLSPQARIWVPYKGRELKARTYMLHPLDGMPLIVRSGGNAAIEQKAVRNPVRLDTAKNICSS